MTGTKLQAVVRLNDRVCHLTYNAHHEVGKHYNSMLTLCGVLISGHASVKNPDLKVLERAGNNCDACMAFARGEDR